MSRMRLERKRAAKAPAIACLNEPDGTFRTKGCASSHGDGSSQGGGDVSLRTNAGPLFRNRAFQQKYHGREREHHDRHQPKAIEISERGGLLFA